MIQTKVEDLLAEKLLEGRFKHGDTVTLDADGDNIILGTVTQ
jgi:ATP-dependent Clp protease ATP-binding subunit ClpA